MSSLTTTETNTMNCGSRLFYQVHSGSTDHRSVMKLVPVHTPPKKTIQTQSLTPSPQLPPPKASSNLIDNKTIKGTDNLTPGRLHVSPATIPRQNVTNSELKLPLTDMPHSAQTTFIATSPIQESQTETTNITPAVQFTQSATPETLIDNVRPRIHIQTNVKALSNKPSSESTVFFASPVTSVHQTQVTVKVQMSSPSLSPACLPQSTVVYESPPTSSNSPCYESDRIRSFSNVTKQSVSNFHKFQTLIPHFPPRSGSPIKWVVKKGGPLPLSPSSSSPISPTVDSEVVAKEQSSNSCKMTEALVGETKSMGNKCDSTVVMYNNRLFFRVNENRGECGEMDLCDEGLDLTEKAACPDEDNVEFVAYIPGQSNSGSGERTENTGQKQTSPEVEPGGCSAEPAYSHSTEMSTCVSAAPCPVADRKLKQTFGITSELRISLQRIEENSCFPQVLPLDYTEPIDEDFLCPQTCPTVSGSSSRVSRTRKRTKCPCCSPAALHRHRARSRPSKPGGGERRDTARKLFKLQPTLVTTEGDSLSTWAMDSDQVHIHQQIQILRKALRLKQAALQKLKNDKNC